MKRILTTITFALFLLSNVAQATFTHCELDYKLKSIALVTEVGKGKATVTCKDALGHEYTKDLKVKMAGLGIKLGVCKAQGHVEAFGLGFSLDEFLSVMGKAEVGLILGNTFSQTIEVGESINPTLEMRLTVGATQYSGNCAGVGSLQGLIFHEKD